MPETSQFKAGERILIENQRVAELIHSEHPPVMIRIDDGGGVVSVNPMTLEPF